MLRTLQYTMRALVLSGLLVLTSGAAEALAQSSMPAESDSAKFVNEFPVALVYQGIARFGAEDYDGAIAAWQGYLDRVGKDADTASINSMMHEAWVREYPLALVYEGLARYNAGDVTSAVASWDRYIKIRLAQGPDASEVKRLIERSLAPEDEMALLMKVVPQR